VGNCCSCPTKGAADRRQSLPSGTAAGPAQTQTTATPRGRRPPLLGSGVSVVRCLANLCAHCETRNCAALASSGVAEVLAPAFKSRRKAGAPPDCPGAARPDTSHDHRESTLGSAPDPGRAGAPWVQSFGESGRQVYATNPSSWAVHHLAVIPGQHGSEIWACDFFCVRTVTFRTPYVFFVIHHASRQVLHVHVTGHPTASWTAQQIVECCGWDCQPPRFLVHDRDSCYAASFDWRVRNLGIIQARTPFRSPRANAIAERWVRSVRTECLDHVFIINKRHLQKVLAEYVGYFNHWRPHRSIGQRAPCAVVPFAPHRSAQAAKIVAIPVLGGLHHDYQHAA